MASKNPARKPVASLRAASSQFEEALAAARIGGSFQSVASDLARLTQEFGRISSELLARNDVAAATFALLRSADCLRVMERWDDARPIYQKVVPLAQQASRADHEAKAWLGIGRLEKFGATNHRAARDAIDRAIRAVGTSPENATLRADILLERADLESAAGELEEALKSVNEAVPIGRNSTDKDLYFNSLFNRAGLHNQLSQMHYKVFSSLPSTTKAEWSHCEDVAEKMRQHLADAFDDMNRALNLAVELKQQTFADGIRDELRIMQLIDQTQQDAIAAATKMHELALRR